MLFAMIRMFGRVQGHSPSRNPPGSPRRQPPRAVCVLLESGLQFREGRDDDKICCKHHLTAIFSAYIG
jgi:hypothetical protein